jgi:Dolichyl-phosphate-mannose-protein mannosyltransferase
MRNWLGHGRETSQDERRRGGALRNRLIVLALLIVVGGWLRFTAITFGYPGTYRPDEEYMINPALGFVDNWDPHFALYPAAQIYIQHAALDVYAHLRGQRGNFRQYYAGDKYARAHVVARWVSALMGTATIALIYFAALPFGAPAALAAAAVMTFCPLHVLDSKFATTDAATVFWLALALAMIPRIAARGRLRDYAFAGLFAGLATATKYPAGAVVFAIAAAHLGARRRAGRSPWGYFADPKIYLAAALTVVVFFCATPYFFLDWAQTLHDYNYQEQFVLHGYSAAGYGWHWLVMRVMPDSFGPAGEVLMLVAMVWALFRRKPGTLSLLAFVVATFFALTSSHQLFYRYILVPLPALAILSGIFVADVIERARAVAPARGAAAAVAGFALLLVPSLVRDVQLDRVLLRPDTRTVARRWIAANIAPGTTIAEIDSPTVYGKPQLYGHYPVVNFENLEALRAKHIRWVLADTYAPLAQYSRGPGPRQRAELESQGTLVFELKPLIAGAPRPIFDPNDAFYMPLRHISSVRQPGPRIRIWRLN